MSPALIAAIEDRLQRGYSKDVIAEEVMASGYTAEQFAEAYNAAQKGTVSSGNELISYSRLLREIWVVMWTEISVMLKMVLLGVAAFVLISTSIFILASVSGIDRQLSFFLTATIVPFIGFIISLVASLTLMRAILKRSEQRLFREHLYAVVKQIVPVTLVTLYLTIVTQVGYMLFIIPGIMATVYFLFATPLTVAGEARGFGALSASTALVYGRFWPTLSRFIVINLVILLIVGAFFILGGSLFGEVLEADTLIGLWAFPFIFVAILILCVAAFYATTCGLVILFESLQAVPSPRPLTIPRSTLETLFKAVVGVVVVLLAAFAFIGGFTGYALLN
jgi:hypothetical protein